MVRPSESPPLGTERTTEMEIPKEQILELIKDRMGSQQASQAHQELPDQVDTDQHAGTLSKFGIDPQELITKFGGNIL